MTSETRSITDASFALLEGLITIAADPAAARAQVAEVRAACQAARAEAEAAEGKAEAARAALDKERTELKQQQAALEREREELKQRRLDYRESERCLRVREEAVVRAREKAAYIGPSAVPSAGFAPAGSIAARARQQDYAEAPSYVTSEFAREPPMLHREGLGGRRPQKRPEV
jgi:hypothetical protein